MRLRDKVRQWATKHQRIFRGAEIFIILILLLLLAELLYNLYGSGFGAYVNLKGELIREKTLWDWLDLLIVPLILAIAGVAINSTVQRGQQERTERQAQFERERTEKQAQTERTIAEDRQQEQRLQTYLDRMSELLLENDLDNSEPDDQVPVVARARTLTALRGLDGYRKGMVVKFLYESGMIGYVKPVILKLNDADLSQARLEKMKLDGAHLEEVNLEGAHLERAYLPGSHLDKSYLQRANLKKATLAYATLRQANLEGACLDNAYIASASFIGTQLPEASLIEAKGESIKLIDAYLIRANLRGAWLNNANFENANLQEANLQETDLRETNFVKANLQSANLAGAKFDEHTTLPDSQKWTTNTDMEQFTNPNHPRFWRSDDISSPAYKGN